MSLSRRALLTAGIGLLSAAVINRFESDEPVRATTIAGGQPGGFYLEFAQLLADQIDQTRPELRCRVLQTAGSVTNIEMARDGRADVAMSQVDTALTALAGRDPFIAPVPIRCIGRVYEDYLQLVVRADSPYRKVGDLAGRMVSMGANGSGTAVVSGRLIDAAGLTVRPVPQPLADAAEALELSAVDALIWVGGVPTPTLVDLHKKIGIRVLPITEQLPVLRDRYGPAYQQVRLPAGSYGQGDEIPTLGVANLLVCADTLPDDVAGAVARTLVERAGQLVPPQALGTQFLDPHTLIHTLDVPLHPGAANAYRELHG